MNIIFNTRNPEGASAAFYGQAFSELEGIHYSDWDHYGEYDIALFMSYPPDLKEVTAARRANPDLNIGLIDPRSSIKQSVIDCVDFMLVDSLEMRDFFSKYHLPIFTYYEYPKLEPIEKVHEDKDTIVIAYHGNKVHLESMYPRVTTALELLAEQHNLEFWAMYNIETLGYWKRGIPRNIPIKHIQWSYENYYNHLANADIGIVPNLMPIRNIQKIKRKSIVSRRHFLDTEDDYLIKFKVPSNAGRIIIFALLGIPVVADMYPSAMQFIRDGHNGFLAYSSSGWCDALSKLISNCQLRRLFASNMRHGIGDSVDFGVQDGNLLRFLAELS